MKFIIVGNGSIGKRHFSILKKLKHEAFFLSRNSHGKITNKMFEEAISLKPNAAIIASPSSFHVEHSLKFLKKNIPVFIEKPIGVNTKEVKVLSKYKSKIYIGYNLYFHKGIEIIKKIINRNEIGIIRNSKIHFGSYVPDWFNKNKYVSKYVMSKKLGGGVLLTSIHEINYAISLFGTVKTIQAQNINTKFQIDTSVEILFKHSNGIVSNISLDFFEKPMRRYLKIIGEKGKIFLDYNMCKVLVYKNRKLKEIKFSDNYKNSFTSSYEKQMVYFIRSIKYKKIPKINTYDESLYDINIVEKIKKNL